MTITLKSLKQEKESKRSKLIIHMNFSIILSISLALICISCNTGDSQIATNNETILTDSIESKPTYYNYDSLTIPEFFEELTKNQKAQLLNFDSSYLDVLIQYDVDTSDSNLINNFYTVNCLHLLFTSEGAADCSKGFVLNIPYYWHWVDPNPRHSIKKLKTDVLLNETAPPAKFGKYASYADIDRTPVLFLTEMLSPEPLYYSECDTFSTFGWCSEREMAFVCLNNAIGNNGKVVTDGNHSWSEFVTKFKTNQNDTLYVLTTVDNTFNSISNSTIEYDEYNEWLINLGDNKMAKWYNKMALSKEAINTICSIFVEKQVMQNIDKKLSNFLFENSKQ